MTKTANITTRRAGEHPVVSVEGLRDLLADLMKQDPKAADMPVVLGHDPEGNPPFHPFVHDDGYPGFALAKVGGQAVTVLWAGYPQLWDDDIDFEEDE